MPWDEINGFVASEYDGEWWLSYVLDKKENTDEVLVKFLHPAGPAASFSIQAKMILCCCQELIS